MTKLPIFPTFFFVLCFGGFSTSCDNSEMSNLNLNVIRQCLHVYVLMFEYTS